METNIIIALALLLAGVYLLVSLLINTIKYFTRKKVQSGKTISELIAEAESIEELEKLQAGIEECLIANTENLHEAVEDRRKELEK